MIAKYSIVVLKITKREKMSPSDPPKTKKAKSKVGEDSEPRGPNPPLPFTAGELQKAIKKLKHVEIINQKEERPTQHTERATGFKPKIAPKPEHLKRKSPLDKRGEQVQESDPLNILDIKPTVCGSVAYLSSPVDLAGAQEKYANKKNEWDRSADLLKNKKEELRGTRWFRIFKLIKLIIEIRRGKKKYKAAEDAMPLAHSELMRALDNTEAMKNFIPIKLDELEKFLEQDNEIARNISELRMDCGFNIEKVAPNHSDVETTYQEIACLDMLEVVYEALEETLYDSMRMTCLRIVEKCIEEIEKCPKFDREEHEPINFYTEEIEKVTGSTLNLQKFKSLVRDLKQSLEEKMTRELKGEHQKGEVQGQKERSMHQETESKDGSIMPGR